MDDNFYCEGVLTTSMATTGAPRHSELPQLTIKFDFFIQTEYLNYFPNQEYTTLILVEPVPFASDYRSATIPAAGDSLSFEDVAKALRGAAGDLIDQNALDAATHRACNMLLRKFQAEETLDLPRHRFLEIRFDVVIQHVHVYAAAESSGMVPASEASHALLEECEVGRGEEEERCCCICFDELIGGGGGGAFRMPCLHVFHGGCIKQWLRRSHYCPLCRYEMPTK